MAMRSALTSPSRAAKWAFISKIPMAPRSTITGRAARIVDSSKLPVGS
jgi:hypothetical protein